MLIIIIICRHSGLTFFRDTCIGRLSSLSLEVIAANRGLYLGCIERCPDLFYFQGGFFNSSEVHCMVAIVMVADRMPGI